MYLLKQQFIRWFNDNVYVIREGQSSWVFHPKSGLGCLIFFLLFVVSLIISLGVTSIMIFKIYPIVFSTLITRLGMAPGLGLPLLIAVFLGYFINLPLFLLTAKCQSKQQVSFELLPLLLFKRCLPSYKAPSKI